MCMQICNHKVSPLDYCLKKFELDCDLILEDPNLKKLLSKCFNFDYKKRPSAEDIFDDEFFIGYTVNDKWF